MPDEPLIRAGFYGKLPVTGDFVGRGLPRAFTDRWDRWVAAHLLDRLEGAQAAGRTALRFLSGPEAFGPAAGVVLPSGDSAGRRFPLTIAAMLPASAAGPAEPPASWLDRIEALGREAIDDRLTADALDARLREIPLPRYAGGQSVRQLAVWRRGERPVPISPDLPGRTLRRLLLAEPEPEP